MTDLHNALENGDLATCRALIEHGADVNAKDHMGKTPMYRAVRYDDHPNSIICEIFLNLFALAIRY